MTTNMEREPYTYRSLDDKSLEIRLIRLSPYPTRDGLLQCELVHRDLADASPLALTESEMTWDKFHKWESDRLRKKNIESDLSDVEHDTDDAKSDMNDTQLDVDSTDDESDDTEDQGKDLKFAALSYVWGPPEPKQRIAIGNCTMDIGPNLCQFLHKIRDMLGKGWTPRTNFLWVDQICINQSDIPERNFQVGLMSQIYSLAVGTVAWLGHLPVAPEIAANRDADRKFHAEHSEDQYQAYVVDEARVFDYKHLDRDTYVRNFNSMYHEYWHRVWIIQEIILCRERYLLDDNGWLDPDELTDISHFVLGFYAKRKGDRTSSADEKAPTDGTFDVMITARHVHESLNPVDSDLRCLPPYGWSLADILTTFGTNGECKLARDVVFALQGLVMPESRVKIDYSRSEGDIMDDVMDGLCASGFGVDSDNAVREDDDNILDKLLSKLKSAPRWGARVITETTRQHAEDYCTKYGMTPNFDTTSPVARLSTYLKLGRILCAITFGTSGSAPDADDAMKQSRRSRLSPFQRAEIAFALNSEIQYLQCTREDWLARLDRATEDKPLQIHTSPFLTKIVPSKEFSYPTDFRSRSGDEKLDELAAVFLRNPNARWMSTSG